MTAGNVSQYPGFPFTSDTENTLELTRFKTIFQVWQSYGIRSTCPWMLALMFKKIFSFSFFFTSLLHNLSAKDLHNLNAKKGKLHLSKISETS